MFEIELSDNAEISDYCSEGSDTSTASSDSDSASDDELLSAFAQGRRTLEAPIRAGWIDWQENYSSLQNYAYTGPVSDVDHVGDPIDYFNKYFSERFLNLICEQRTAKNCFRDFHLN